MKSLIPLILFAVLLGILLALALTPRGKAFVAWVGEALYGAATGFMHRQGLLLCAVQLPNGSLVHIASGYGASKSMTAISNATEAVATLEASHGVVENDILEMTSGWSRLNGKIVRADSVSTNDVTLEDINTSSTTIYPAGTGTGSIREITGWTQLQQILESGSSGGEQQFLEYQFLEADAQVRIPTFKNASGLTFSIADDPSLAGYILAETANDDRLPRAVRITLPSGAKIFYNAYISLNKTPSLNVNQVMACQVTLSLLNDPVRYSA
jgi:hypothetical protein